MPDTQPDATAHESYGSISFSPIHGQARPMFGSPLKHTDYIRVLIHTAELTRSLSQDHVFSKNQIFVGYMTHAQMAEAFLSPNRGGSVPITIEYVTGDEHLRDYPPERPSRNMFNTDVSDTLNRIIQECDNLAEASKGPAKRKAQGISNSLRNALPFIRDRMEDFLDQTTDDAKRDVEYFIAEQIRQAGLAQSLTLQQHEITALPDPNDATSA